jgi:hypothetical protein
MSTVQRVLALAAIAAFSACVKSDKAECIAGHALCGGACVPMASDPLNCGACGNVCPGSQACVAGACVATCESMLHAPIGDAWGDRWDGLERPPAPYVAARDACAGIGGRLPSLSQLDRVSAAKSGAVGDWTKLNYVWALTPYDDGNAYIMTLANGVVAFGGVTTSVMTTSRPYRCVCPAPRPAAFTEGACFGPAGAGCAALGGDARFNFDVQDRPYVGKVGAIYECALAGGELASAERLGAALTQGLPNGTGVWLHTAEETGHYDDGSGGHYEDDAILQFTGPSVWALTVGGGGWAYYPRPFRCFGPASTAPVAPAVPGGFQDRRGKRTIDPGPDLAATTYTSAVADCVRRGGHLPTLTELVQLVEEGLPAWSYAGQRWTSDQGNPGYAVTLTWTGSAAWPDADLAVTAPTRNGVPYYWSSVSVADSPLSNAVGLPYRCVYHAVDPSYGGPADAQCSSGCFSLAPGTSATSPRPRMWFDRSNRLAASYYAAVATCAATGARVASARDLLEAIRAGLDNPGGDAVATSDLVGAIAARTITGWSGSVNPGFADTGATYVGLTASLYFRCMWTNEIR